MPEVNDAALAKISKKMDLMGAHLQAAITVHEEIQLLLNAPARPKPARKQLADPVAAAIARRNATIGKKYRQRQ